MGQLAWAAGFLPGVVPLRHAGPAAVLLAVALFAACSPPASAQDTGDAQDTDAAQVLGATPVQAGKCTGPLGSLLPECQTGKAASIDVPARPRIAGGSRIAPNIRTGSAGPVEAAGAEAAALLPPEPPAPPTDFQRFVASSIGEILPIFGASLFERVPTTFAPLDRVPVTADYVVGPGDQILLRAWGQVNLDLELTVDRAGAVFVPQAGNMNVAGLQFQQLSAYLRSQLGRVFRNFDLDVNLGQLRSIQIFVVGEVRRPGTYTVSSLSTLVNALFASGGPSNQGSMRHIQLKRGADIVTEFDLYDLLLNGDKSKDTRLLPGDVVYFPPSGARAAVGGSVRTPAIYELKGESKVADLIQMAGGLSAVANVQRAALERIHQNDSREVLEFKLDATGIATGIGDGDLLYVSTIDPRFANAVTLRGNVANPGRFPWHAGMRLHDVIPDKESLITRDYWKKHNALGFVPPDERVPADPSIETRRAPAGTDIAAFVPEINWTYAVIERQNARDLKTELVAFNPGKLVLDGDETQNLELRPGDVVTIFSQADIRVAVSQQNPKVRLEGEFHTAGVYDVRPGETLGSLIQRAGGLTPQAYLYGSEFTRESTRVDQQRRLDQFTDELERDLEQTASRNIGRATNPEDTLSAAVSVQNSRQLIARMRSLKATGRIVLHLEPGSNDLTRIMDLPLEAGDKFMVPARPATVNVFGAVYNQNSFLFEPAQRVEDYLRRSGGPTRTADQGHMFIIRADGSVVPKRDTSPFRKAFAFAPLNPGDSIVMPERVFKPGFLRELRDWTEIVGQLGLGAAAVNTLK
ncbi:MAG: SLBB domain-containing protein [Bryobacteraceae bacterium]|jgi:protein involved in polysaccharide export with SLBB domain